MGPTCSIVYENEPAEKNTMTLPPRSYTTTFFNWKELSTSILQGLVITAGTLTVYQLAVYNGYNEAAVRTMVFITLITANISLTLVNRSFYYSVLTTMKYKNNLIGLITGITVLMTALLLYVPPLSRFFGFHHPTTIQLLTGMGTGALSVLWYEAVKWIKRKKSVVAN
jgi:Ca2+-transporting ATPase